jgi:hypothetical protein
VPVAARVLRKSRRNISTGSPVVSATQQQGGSTPSAVRNFERKWTLTATL